VTVKDLKIGQEAQIFAFSDKALGHHLVEMGVVPGETISIERIAPMGDPIAIRVSNLLFAFENKKPQLFWCNYLRKRTDFKT
jgi:ferrous iron transport protein A